MHRNIVSFIAVVCWHLCHCLAAQACYSRIPLGLSNGLIKDSQLAASSVYKDTDWDANQARLRSGQCWCGRKTDPDWKNEFLQVDLKGLVVLSGIAVQGDPNWSPNYAKFFSIQISNKTDAGFTSYSEAASGAKKIFVGVGSNSEIVYRWLSAPPTLLSVRVKAEDLFRTDKDRHFCLRLELFGCYVNSSGQLQMGGDSGLYPLGMESNVISNNQIKASDSTGTSKPSDARLNNVTPWCVAKSQKVWLEVDLGRTLAITGLSLQGDLERETKTLVTKYKIEFLETGDGGQFKLFEDSKGNTLIFPGNVATGSNAQFQAFPRKLIARRIRFLPEDTSGSGEICARLELFGGHPVCNEDLTHLIHDKEIRAFDVGSNQTRCFVDGSKLAVNFTRPVVISGIAITGDSESNNWLLSYKFSFTNRITKSEFDKEFSGTIGRTDLAVNWLEEMAVVESVQLSPRKTNGKPCLRFRVLGCEQVITPPQIIRVTPKAETVEVVWNHPPVVPFEVSAYELNFSWKKYHETLIKKILPRNQTSFIVTGVSPACKYTFRLGAYYQDFGSFAYGRGYTLPKAPATPKMLRVVAFSDFTETTTLNLMKVGDENGPVSHYELVISQETMDLWNVNSSDLYPQNISSKKGLAYFLAGKFDRSATLPSIQLTAGAVQISGPPGVFLPTFGIFFFYFRAVIAGETIERYDPEKRTYYSNASATKIERRSLLPMTSNKHFVTRDMATFNLTGQPVPNARYYQIIAVDISSDREGKHLKLPNSYTQETLKTYGDSRPGEPYIAAQFSANSFDIFKVFQLGDGLRSSNVPFASINGGQYQSFYNGPLEPGVTYTAFQRVYDHKGHYLSSPWLQPFTTLQRQGAVKSQADVGVIIGVVLPVIVIVMAALLTVYIYWLRTKKKEPRPNYTHDHPMSFYKNVDDELNRMNASHELGSYGEDDHHAEMHAPLGPRPSKAHVIPQDPNYSPIPVGSLPKYVAEKKKDSRHGFTEEFKSISFEQEYSWEEGQKAHNKMKNRYNNIAAYDHSRVVLPLVDDIIGSDYINANYIHGYNTEREYIAAQGPKPETLNDFWRMIWENRPLGIVMLTSLVEKGRKKCEQYWPNSGSCEYGTIKVTLSDVDKYADYTIRKLVVEKKDSKITHVVTQFHFLGWPDHGAPEYPTSLLNFCRKFRTLLPKEICCCPIVVHCSAGVGRTGTFIVIDSMLQLIKDKKVVDVYNYLKFIRMNRVQMVQTEDQYVFTYEALLEFVACGITEFSLVDLRRQVDALCRKDAGSGLTGFESQFKRISIITPRFHEHECKQAHKKFNRPKSRSLDVAPRDQDRVILSHVSGIDGSDYINAVYVHGYKQKNAFIATQSPLKNTIEDFWRMMDEANVTSIVMLNTTHESEENFPSYWPADTELAFHSLTVKLKELKVVRDIIRRTISLHRKKASSTKVIHQYQLTGWNEGALPELDTILELLRLVETSQHSLGSGTICVHCSDGTGRTGTFIATSIVIERLKVEQLVDVFQAVRSIRLVRPGFVENPEHYKFIHDVAIKFVDSFATYSNF